MDIVHYDDAVWQDEAYKREASRRTSLITDPLDGQVPALTPEAEKQKAARAAANGRSGSADSAESRTLAERCISWLNVGPPMLPPSYNANLQILQTRDHVIIFHEMIHDVRIIPLDGRPHLAQDIRQLAGDSRGHWEGDTLVVDTTNFSGKTNFKAATRNNRQDIFATKDLHVVERFTRVDSDAIRYEFTVEDPATWTRRWSGRFRSRGSRDRSWSTRVMREIMGCRTFSAQPGFWRKTRLPSNVHLDLWFASAVRARFGNGGSAREFLRPLFSALSLCFSTESSSPPPEWLSLRRPIIEHEQEQSRKTNSKFEDRPGS